MSTKNEEPEVKSSIKDEEETSEKEIEKKL